MNNKYCMIITTTDNQQLATQLAADLVSRKLAACVQLENIISYFYFDNHHQQQAETRLVIKTIDKNYQKIVEYLQNKHNYQLPQIIKLLIDEGTPDYLRWIDQVTE